MDVDNTQVSIRATRERWKSWSETTNPNPSLGNSYRTFEWIAANDRTTNYHVLAFFLALLTITCCLVASFKYLTRASTRWHVSPLAVAFVLLHFTSDIEFGTLAESISSTNFWDTIKSFVSLLHPFHNVNRYNGPTAYTFLVLAVWETLVFVLSPIVLSGQHPRSRNNAEWGLYCVTMAMALYAFDGDVHMPLIQRTRKYMSIQEAYESTESFMKTVAAFTAIFMLFTAMFALVLDMVLFDGCMLDSLNTQLSAPHKEQSASVEVHETSVQTSVNEDVLKQPVDPSVDITSHVENYLWKQMCLVKQQAQAIEALSVSSGRDNLAITYSKLGQMHANLLPVRPVLDGLIAVLHHRTQRIDHFQRHLVSIDEALQRIQTQMCNLILEHNDVNFVRSAPDQDVGAYVNLLDHDAERFVHVQLDRQQIKEETMEDEDNLDILEDVLNLGDKGPFDFSGDLYAQLFTLEKHIDRIRELKPRIPERYNEEQELPRYTKAASPALPLPPVSETPFKEVIIKEEEVKPLLFSTFGTEDVPLVPIARPIASTPKRSPRKAPSTPVRPSSAVTDENAEPTRAKSPSAGVRKSADYMVVGLWNNTETLEFRSDNFLRGHAPSDLLKPDDLLAMGELGRYLIVRVRGNRAETAAASKIIINLEKSARTSKENRTVLNVGANNLNYFRSCMWLGQARLTKFPPSTRDRVFTEIPIEGLIKLAGYGPDGIKSMNMLPVPKETWAQYLERLSQSMEIKKVKELHEWLERYLGGVPALLEREVPRAEGWDTGVALDANRCLYRHLENMMLLPPYPPEIEKALSIYRIEKTDEKEINPNFVGSALVENLLSSPDAKNKSPPRFQAL